MFYFLKKESQHFKTTLLVQFCQNIFKNIKILKAPKNKLQYESDNYTVA